MSLRIGTDLPFSHYMIFYVGNSYWEFPEMEGKCCLASRSITTEINVCGVDVVY